MPNARTKPEPVKFTFAGLNFPHTLAMLPVGTVAQRRERYRYTGGYRTDGRPVTAATESRMFYHDSEFMPGMRWTWADEVDGTGRAIDHRGWWMDEDGYGDKARGLVFRLPKGRGFLAGWSMGDGMLGEVHTDTVYGDEVSAAFAADSIAESVAEMNRESNEDEED